MSAPVIYFDLGNTLVFGPADNRQPFDDAVSTIEELWWRGYKIGLLSDQNPGTSEQDVRQKLIDYGLESYRFDVITISSEFDPPIYKPAAEIFEAAAAKAGHATASNNTIFVTEDIDHVEAARDLGWRSIHKPFGSACTPASGECIENLDELLAIFPQLEVDVYIRDAPADTGDDQFTGGNFWNSPDLWIRNQKDDGLVHQSPEAGQDNWFYTRVHNRGTGIARLFYVGYNVKEWAGTQFIYPYDYQPYISNPFMVGNLLGVNLDPGDSTIVYTKWEAADIPPVGTHACWLAVAQPIGGGMDLPPSGAHVWEHNNLAQKNLLIVDLIPGETGEVSIVIGSRYKKQPGYYTIELHRSRNALNLPVALSGQSARAMGNLVQAGRDFVHKPLDQGMSVEEVGFRFIDPARVELTNASIDDKGISLLLESGSTLTWNKLEKRRTQSLTRYIPEFSPASLIKENDGRTSITFASGLSSGIGIALRPQQIVRTKLCFTVPQTARPGDQYELDLVQRGEDGRIEGGVTMKVIIHKQRARKPGVPGKKAATARKQRKNT